MATIIMLIIGSAFIGWGLGWQVGVGAFICCYAMVTCITANLLTVGRGIISHR